MVSGGMTLVKYLLFLFNFIFWLTGMTLLTLGTVIQISYRTYINILGNDFLAAPIILISCGIIVAILGFFGCCGAIRENYCMTMTFAVLLGILIILEMAFGIAGYVLRKDLDTIVKDQMNNGLHNYNETGYEGLTLAWNNMQQEFSCCGVIDYKDWSNSTVYNKTQDVPVSCCISPIESPGCNRNMRKEPAAVAEQNIFVTGCIESMQKWVETNVGLVGGIGAGVAVVQIIVIFLLCMLSRQLTEVYERQVYY